MAVKKQTTRKTESPKVSKPKDQGAAVIVKLQRPPLFNPMTGEPAKAIPTTFEPRHEWPAFVKNPLGYVIAEVVYLPEGAKTVEEILEGK
jgi:hypothetical protein